MRGAFGPLSVLPAPPTCHSRTCNLSFPRRRESIVRGYIQHSLSFRRRPESIAYCPEWLFVIPMAGGLRGVTPWHPLAARLRGRRPLNNPCWNLRRRFQTSPEVASAQAVRAGSAQANEFTWLCLSAALDNGTYLGEAIEGINSTSSKAFAYSNKFLRSSSNSPRIFESSGHFFS